MFDWDRPETQDAALSGADAVYLITPALVEKPSPVVEPFLRRAAQAGVRRVVLLSSMGVSYPNEDGPSGRHKIERLVARSSLDWTILRPGGFAQNFSESFLLPGILHADKVATATGEGAVALVDADDIAAVAEAALLDPGHAGCTYVVTGPEALTFADAAEIIGRAAGRRISFQPNTSKAFAGLLHGAGMPPDYAAAIVRNQESIRNGWGGCGVPPRGRGDRPAADPLRSLRSRGGRRVGAMILGRPQPMDAFASPPWLDRQEYPFRHRRFDTGHGMMHYVDEGAGDVILFVHGNPSWSFEYRRLIAHFSQSHRCIAIDHIGFGLSDKPYDATYLPQFHAANLAQFIEGLGLRDLVLVVHDWGGPIGLSYAINHSDNVTALVVYNSWLWPVQEFRTLATFSRLVGSPLGRWLCRYLNLFPKVLMPASVGDRASLPKRVHEHFIRPFPTPRSRKGTWVFPKAILGQSAWLDALWRRRAAIANKPMLILWGLKDQGFGTPLLERWKSSFADHETVTFETVGHCAPEEIGTGAVEPILSLLARASRRSGAPGT